MTATISTPNHQRAPLVYRHNRLHVAARLQLDAVPNLDPTDVFGAASALALSTSDENNLQLLVDKVREASGGSHALVGELSGPDWDQVTTLAIATPDGAVSNFSYLLDGSACSEVLTRTTCVYQKEVARLFPKDPLLAQMGIESYIGLPILDTTGRPVGIVIIMNRAEISWSEASRSIALLELIKPRVSCILERRRVERDIAGLLASTTSAKKHDSLPLLLEALDKAMMTSGSFIFSVPPGGDAPPVLLHQTISEDPDGLRLSLDLHNEIVNGSFTEPEVLTSDALIRAPAPTTGASRPWLVIPIVGDHAKVIGAAGLWHRRDLDPRIADRPVIQSYGERISVLLQRHLHETERLASERRLHELERVERIGILAGGIAHDFNNILVGVLGNVDYLLHEGSGTPAQDLQEVLRDIRDAAVSATELCKQLMTYASRSEATSTVFDVCTEVDEISRLAQTTLGVSRLFQRATPPHPVWIKGDPLQIRQLVMNLVTNAGEAIGPHGCVNIDVQSTMITTSVEFPFQSTTLPIGHYAVITVSDNGHGIPPEILGRIFDPFFTTKSDGYGLGLASAMDTVRAHNGWMNVETTADVGSRFTMYFPLTAAPNEPVVQSDREWTDAKNDLPRALIIDDDVRIRKVLGRLASRARFSPLLAGGGREGLQIYTRHRSQIDLVILDLSMPDMDGHETLKRLRAINPDVRVLISSGDLSPSVDEPLLPKPYTYADFECALNGLLERAPGPATHDQEIVGLSPGSRSRAPSE